MTVATIRMSRDPPSGVPPVGEPAGEPADFLSGARLGRPFFERPATVLARALLGMLVVRVAGEGVAGGYIVETEAYAGPDDRASHARAGMTRRTSPMFGPAGHAYVYLVYGMHHCLNVVAERDGVAAAVLIRALQPCGGETLMRQRRGRPHEPAERLGAGPARLCTALAIDRTLDGVDLTTDERIWLADPGPQIRRRLRATGLMSGQRVGVAYAGEPWAGLPWRFGLRGHASLSRPFPTGPR